MPRKSFGEDGPHGAGKSHDAQPKAGKATRDELLWLETYFIVFAAKRRPTLAQVEHALADAGPHLRLENPAANDDGLFQSILIESPEDHAAVEVSFDSSEQVVEQNLEWAKQLQKQLTAKQLQRMVGADARFEVAHFERVEHGGSKSSAGKSPDQSEGGFPARSSRRKSGDDYGGEGDAADEWLAAHGAGDDFGDDDYGDDYGDSFEEDAEAAMESFDPTCLLTVVEALASLTKGITFDPASGEVV